MHDLENPGTTEDSDMLTDHFEYKQAYVTPDNGLKNDENRQKGLISWRVSKWPFQPFDLYLKKKGLGYFWEHC